MNIKTIIKKMTSLIALPFLNAKLTDFEALHVNIVRHLEWSLINELFDYHYTHEFGLDDCAYNIDRDALDAEYKSRWDLSCKNIKDLKAAIGVYNDNQTITIKGLNLIFLQLKKHISINNVLPLIRLTTKI